MPKQDDVISSPEVMHDVVRWTTCFTVSKIGKINGLIRFDVSYEWQTKHQGI